MDSKVTQRGGAKDTEKAMFGANTDASVYALRDGKIEERREAIRARKLALELACKFGGAQDEVVARAKAFLDFVSE